MNLHGFKEVYKQSNIYVLIFSVDHNGMAGHLTGSDCVGFLRSAVYTMQWMGLMWNGSEDGNVRSVKRTKALTVKMETLTLIGKGR